MIHNTAHAPDIGVDVELSLESGQAVGDFIIRVGNLSLLDAQCLLLVADDLDSGLAVGAQKGEAPWHDDDGITTDNVTTTGGIGDFIEEGSPVLVSNSRSAEGDDSNILEELLMGNIDVADASQSTSKTDTGDVEKVKSGLLLELGNVPVDIVSDGTPHVVVGLLNLALGAGVIVDNLG